MFKKGFAAVELLVILGAILVFIYWKMSGGSLFNNKIQENKIQEKRHISNVKKPIIGTKLERKINQNLTILQKNIEFLTKAEELPIKNICNILGNDVCKIAICDTERGKIAEPDIGYGKQYCYIGYYKIKLSINTPNKDIKLLSSTLQAKEDGIVKNSIKMIMKYRKEKINLYNYIQDINLMKTKLEVARTLNSTKTLSTLQKQLTQIEYNIKKDLAKSNMR